MVCPDGAKGKKPTICMKIVNPIMTVYMNKEMEEPLELCGACCCCSLYTLCCWKPDESKGDFGAAQGLPVNEGYDPGLLCKCCMPCPAVHYADPDNEKGMIAVIALTLLCPCCCGGGCIYTNFLWKPDVKEEDEEDEE